MLPYNLQMFKSRIDGSFYVRPLAVLGEALSANSNIIKDNNIIMIINYLKKYIYFFLHEKMYKNLNHILNKGNFNLLPDKELGSLINILRDIIFPRSLFK